MPTTPQRGRPGGAPGMAAHADPFSVLGDGEARRRTQSRNCDLLFSPTDSALRLARVRRVLAAKDVDALVFVAGVDSFENAGCIKALNYLLCGASGVDLATPLLIDDALDDSILCVHAGGARVYTTPAAGARVARLTAAWPGVEVLAMDERAFRNQDAFEGHKILGFRQLLAGFKRVGFALPGKVPDMVRAMEVEKWPIVQSYALDGGGQRRFFTMEHEAVDCSAELDAAYRAVGAHDVAAALAQQAPLFAQHWEQTARSIQSHVAGAGKDAFRGDADPAPHEPLVTYFEYGAMRRREALRHWRIPAPQLLAGAATDWASPTPPSAAADPGAGVVHCTVEACDPQAPLLAARTLLLTSGAVAGLAPLGARGDYTRGIVPAARLDDAAAGAARRVAELYGVLGHTWHALLDDLRGGAFGQKGERKRDAAVAQQRFCQVAAQLDVALDGVDPAAQLTASATQYDLGPFCCDDAGSGAVAARRVEHTVTYLRLHLAGVRVAGGAAPLGGLLYGDTVATAPGGGAAAVLTRGVAQWRALACSDEERAAAQNMRQALDRAAEAWEKAPAPEAARRLTAECPLGAYVCRLEPDEGGHVFVPCTGFGSETRLSGSVDVFSAGIVLRDRDSGAAHPLLFDEALSRLVVCNDPGLDRPAYAALCHTAAWTPPLHVATAQALAARADPVGTPQRCVVLCMQPGTPAKRQFVADVLPAWRAALGAAGVAVDAVDDVPPEYLHHGTAAACAAPRERRRPPSAMQLYQQVGEYRPFGAKREVEDPDVVRRREMEAAEARVAAAAGDGWAGFRHRLRVAEAAAAHAALYGADAGKLPPLASRASDPGPAGGELAVHAVAGWPGAGKHKFIAQLRNAAAAAEAAARSDRSAGPAPTLHVLENSLDDGVAFNPPALYRRVRGVVKEWEAGGRAGRHLIILSVPGAEPLPLVAHHLSQLRAELPAVRLATCTVLVSADHVYANHYSSPPFHLLPGLSGQLARGYVSQFVLSPGTGTVPTAPVERLLRSVNPAARVVYDAAAAVQALGIVPAAEDARDAPVAPAMDLSSPQAVEEQRLAVADPVLHARQTESLQLVNIRYDRLITTKYRVQQFMQRVAEHSTGDDGLHGRILRCKAQLHVEGQSVQISVTRCKPYLNRLKVLSTLKTLRHSQQLVFVGMQLDVQELKDFTRLHLTTADSVISDPYDTGAKSQVKEKLPFATRDSLQDTDVEDINTANQYRKLPEDWFFDGINYCYDGEGGMRSQKLRPDIEDVLEEYIAKRNGEIKEYNASIDRQLEAERPETGAPPTASYYPEVPKD